ncbi:putative secreted protein (plasmid) [Candidatus Protochlamydia naegleriophila]|uniref:Putative secreted protein n=1 Tax=Candidatus Protochlamydia naegleriophila TaxID=389348 RepID=A0A0U5JE78_9BACT|nr:putative secreted protein [Candidatus Protochlamydia naegleriophila]
MKSIGQFILAACFLTVTSSFTSQTPSTTQGNVFHSFMSGKIQCQSQV